MTGLGIGASSLGRLRGKIILRRQVLRLRNILMKVLQTLLT